MVEAGNYAAYLARAFAAAQELVGDADALAAFKVRSLLLQPLKTERDGRVVPLGLTVAEAIETIVGNLNRNKYLYSILLTALVEKLVNPTQDIRIGQTRLKGGYSNRSTDEKHVTPFLKEHNLTHCAASGAESGRNFERPESYALTHTGNPQGSGNREAFLGILHAVQEDNADPLECATLLLALDRLNNPAEQAEEVRALAGLTIEEAHALFSDHYRRAHGRKRARLPVLAIQAIYQSLVPEVARYHDAELLPVNRQTANDKKRWIGDIQINRRGGGPFEAVEVKSGKQISRQMVLALRSKIRNQAVDRYYILSTESEYIAKNDVADVQSAVDSVRRTAGCQVIVNGLLPTLRYYLRLVADPQQFIQGYNELLRSDQDVNPAHRALWNEILQARAQTE